MIERVVAGRYQLGESLGIGGMGRVWLARDVVLRRDVAIKEVLLPPGLSDADREELCLRTVREAQAAARLNHPNVVQIYDVVEEQDRPWIVMEYVKSRSLYQVIKDAPLAPNKVAEIGLAVLAALRAAHSAGVLHRDVKPGNVLLAEDGRVLLTDFGLATFTEAEGSVTRPGLVRGSVQYVAPERARHGTSSEEADLWALGATLYTAVEGHAPYARGSSIETLTALATQPPDPPRRAGPLRPVLIGLLKRDPRSRMGKDEVERYLARIAGVDLRSRVRLARYRGARAVAPIGPARDPDPVKPKTTTVDRQTGRPGARGDLPGLTRPGPPKRRVAGVIVAGSALALVLCAGTVAYMQQNRKGRESAPPPANAAPTTAAPVASPCAQLPVTRASSTPATSPTVVMTVPPPTGGVDQYALMSEFRLYVDPSEFRVGVPVISENALSNGSMVCFTMPEVMIGVDQWQAPSLVPAAYLSGLDNGFGGNLPDYHKLSLDSVQTRPGEHGAELNFTYKPVASPVQVRIRIDRVDTGRVYLIIWQGSMRTWSMNEPWLRLTMLSFHPAWPTAPPGRNHT